MQKLTKVEEEIMQIIWEIEPCLVSDIITKIGEPKPPHSTISSIVRILEKKDFVNHKAYGRTHEYFSLVSKKEYSKTSLKSLVKNYFSGSMDELVSFMVKENDLSLKELSNTIEKLNQHKDQQSK